MFSVRVVAITTLSMEESVLGKYHFNMKTAKTGIDIEATAGMSAWALRFPFSENLF